jgi:hypothetical protein
VSDAAFVPADFVPPRELVTPRFRLVPLAVEHNASDHAAWTSSIPHVAATSGFAGQDWPPARGMSLEENREDLAGHARDFAERTGFTYTVLAPGTDEVIGCVYIYPVHGDRQDAVRGGEGRAAQVLSWVRADHADLDAELAGAVTGWLSERWPFAHVEYAPR